MFKKENNGNWKGGICDIRHVDELTHFPDYCHSLTNKIKALTLPLVDDCWVWLGMVDKRDKRAYIKVGTRRWPVARVLMFFRYGKVGDRLACHSCDNPQCVNPEHLWLGTHKDNQRDKWRKGRQNHKVGEDSTKAKLQTEQVRKIRTLHAQGHTVKDIACLYAISVSNVYKILKRKSWAHVK